MKPRYKPSLWWIALAPILLITGVGGGTALLLTEVFNTGTEITFTAPADRTFTIDDPGTYIISHDYRTYFRGRKYDEDPQLPESTQVSIKGPSGDVPIKESWGSGSTSEEHSRVEVGRCEITSPGEYTLSVSGLPAPRVMTFSQSVIVRIVFSAIASILLSLLGWFGAPALVIIVLSNRLKDKRRLRAENPQLFEPEEPLRG